MIPCRVQQNKLELNSMSSLGALIPEPNNDLFFVFVLDLRTGQRRQDRTLRGRGYSLLCVHDAAEKG